MAPFSESRMIDFTCKPNSVSDAVRLLVDDVASPLYVIRNNDPRAPLELPADLLPRKLLISIHEWLSVNYQNLLPEAVSAEAIEFTDLGFCIPYGARPQIGFRIRIDCSYRDKAYKSLLLNEHVKDAQPAHLVDVRKYSMF